MASKKTQTPKEWVKGQSVNVGNLKGLIVVDVQREGTIVRYTLRHSATGREYTFVPRRD